jgi:hypothetical protein
VSSACDDIGLAPAAAKLIQFMVSHIGEIVAIEHEDFGSIEGRLERLPGRERLHFAIYEPLGGQDIRCEIAADELLEQAMTNFRKRVEVYGTIKYRKDGKPVSIRVEEIVPFPASDKLPSFREVHGILGKASWAWIADTGTRIASLGWLQAEPDKEECCRQVLEAVEDGKVLIVTSALTIAVYTDNLAVTQDLELAFKLGQYGASIQPNLLFPYLARRTASPVWSGR